MADDTGTKIAVVASALVALGIVCAALADTPRLCAPGQQKPCTCADPSASGMQACAPDGTAWGACGQCPAPQPAAAASAVEAAPQPPTASCSVKIGVLKVSNRKLGGDIVAAEVAKAESAVSGPCCFAAAGDKASGKAVLRVTIGRDGKVANVVSVGKGPGPAVPACALDAFRELEFATACRPEGAKCNASSTVDVPLTFEAGK